jgi:ribosome biogenesis GTPase A
LFLFLSFCYGAFTADPGRDDQKYILFIGNSGVGKSTIINSLLGKRVTPTGINPDGLTKYAQTYECDGIVYIDTPAIIDGTDGKRAAKEIAKTLMMNGRYSLFFIVRRKTKFKVTCCEKTILDLSL